MKQDFFTYLPPEIIINILTRLPIETIISFKCVCKSLLDLVESPEFSRSHLSMSAPGLAIFKGMGRGRQKLYKVFDFVEDLEQREYAYYCYIDFNFHFNFPYHAYIHSSVNGLLFMYDQDLNRPLNLLVCNPITRDYITLPHYPDCDYRQHTFGFGVSKMTDQYKLVRIFRVVRIFRIYNDIVPSGSQLLEQDLGHGCEVYTLGTGSWRCIEAGSQLMYQGCVGVFLNGNLHWLATDSKKHQWISCFDLETELFSILCSTPKRLAESYSCFSTLGDHLCLCCNYANEIIIWMMKEYGDEKSWTKEYVIKKPSDVGFWERFCWVGFPVKVFKDGDILIAEENGPGLFCYSKRTRSIQEIDPFHVISHCRTSAVIYTPSFLSVKMFAMEDISSF